MSVEVDFVEVVRIIQQFLAENNLVKTLKTLQEETNIIENNLDDIELFKANIISGKWDYVIKVTLGLKISNAKLSELYEHIAIEMIEMGEISAARFFIRETDPLSYLKENFPEKYLHLEHLLTLTHFDKNEAYPLRSSKESRRRYLAQSLTKEITVAPPSRLLTLIGEALRWQKSLNLLEEGTVYDLVKGASVSTKTEVDEPVIECYTHIKFPKKQYAQCAKFSSDASYFVTGSLDGFIEVWNYMTGKLRKDVSCQANDNMMLMGSAVHSMAFSNDGKYLAVGEKLGLIRIWRISTGGCILRIQTSSKDGVTALCFNQSANMLTSGGFDGIVRLYGLKNGRLLSEFVGHTSYINDVLITASNNKIISVSSDGTTKIWKLKNTECLFTLHFNLGSAVNLGTPCRSVIQILPSPFSQNHYFICDKSEYIYHIDENGKLINTLKLTAKSPQTEPNISNPPHPAHTSTNPLSQDTIAVTFSANGEYIYSAREDCHVYIFNSTSKNQVGSFLVSQSGTIGLTHHPKSNIIATLSVDGLVRLWKS